MNWGLEDFVAAGGLLALVAGAAWLALRKPQSPFYLVAFALAVVSAFGVAWISLAVGVIGDPGNPANLVYAAAGGVMLAGAARARLRARGMARTLAVAALVPAGICVAAALKMLPGGGVLLFNVLLMGALAASAGLFALAGRQQDPHLGAV